MMPRPGNPAAPENVLVDIAKIPGGALPKESESSVGSPSVVPATRT